MVQWRIQEFKKEPGGAVSLRYHFLGLPRDCFDNPSHIFYAFIVRVENKVDKHCIMITIKFMRVLES